MNLKDFSLLKEDNESYHIQHPKGKTLVVSKSGMAEKAHQAIKALKKPHMAEGGELSVNVSDEPLDASKLNVPKVGDDLKKEQAADAVPTQQQSLQNLASMTGNMTPEYAAATQPAPAPAAAPAAVPSQVTDNSMAQFDQANKMGQAAGQDMYQSAQAQENAAQQMTPHLQQQLTDAQANAQDTQDRFHKNYLEEAAKADELMHKYETMQIDPNHVINNMSTGGKISTAIGLMLGGLSAGFTGRNPAMDVINNAIERDIDAQKANKTGVMNLWQMNREMASSDLEADIKTKQQVLGAAQAIMNAHAAKTGAAQTKLAAAGALQNISMQQMQMQQQLAAMKLGQGQVTAENLPAIVMAKQKAGLITPEQGEAAIKEAGTSAQAAQMRDELTQSFHNLSDKLMGGALSPDAASAKEAFAANLEHLMVGRYNEDAAKKEINAIMPGKLDVLSPNARANRLTRLNQLLDNIQYNNPHLQGMGLGSPAPHRKIK